MKQNNQSVSCHIKDCKEEVYELNTQLCFDHWNEYESDDLVICQCWKNFNENGRHDYKNCKCKCHLTERRNG